MSTRIRSWAAASLACVGTAAALDAAPQTPGLAGATRPKLEVLQSLPEAQLFPLMNLLADSLGVRCDYCHVQTTPNLAKTPWNVGGWAWDRDDKPQKRRAREMMRMVIDVNAGLFTGESRVTCYTCHRGSPQPLRTPPLPPAAGSATTPVPPPLPSVDRVWASYVSAVGHVDAAAPGTGTIISGWDERPEGRYGKIEIVIAGPDRYRATLSTADASISQGLDGDVAWVATNDRVQRLAGADVERARRVAARYWPVRPRPADLKIVGVERLGDRDAFVAAARIDPVTTTRLYFDVVTGLLRREMTATETMLLPLQEQVDYDDYRNAGGVQLPYRVEMSDGSAYSTVTRTFLQIRRNVPVEDAVFRPPAGAR